MTLAELARANGMSLDEFFAQCWRWKTGLKYAPMKVIRSEIVTLNTQGIVPLYVSQYIGLFSVNSTLPN